MFVIPVGLCEYKITTAHLTLAVIMFKNILEAEILKIFKEPCSPIARRGLLLFSSTPRNETVDMPRENCQTVPITL